MNNTCEVCKQTIDAQWTTLQNEVKKMYGGIMTNRRAYAFVERCIYCYKQYIEMIEKDEHNWYQEVMRAVEKRFKW